MIYLNEEDVMKRVSLEKEALEICKMTSEKPFIYELPIGRARDVFAGIQRPIKKMPADVEDRVFYLEDLGSMNVRIFKPIGRESDSDLPVMLYIHGAGWSLGDADTYDKLGRELAVRTGSVVFLPEYSLSPEAKFPTAIEECYSLLELIKKNEGKEKWDTDRIVIAGDSVGGNIATVIARMTVERKGPKIRGQLLYYPAVDHNFTTDSYKKYGEGYYLTTELMKWAWKNYLPIGQKVGDINVSPFRATLEELSVLPPTIILNGEADVLRTSGEEYSDKLRSAGVAVTQMTFRGTIHDFVMLNALDQTNATRAAMDASVNWVNKLDKEDKDEAF